MSTKELPYIWKTRHEEDRFYNPKYGDDRICKCGHVYHRHFDSYENMEACGCKYCECYVFEENTDEIIYGCRVCDHTVKESDIDFDAEGRYCPICRQENKGDFLMRPMPQKGWKAGSPFDPMPCPYPSCGAPGCDGMHAPPKEDQHLWDDELNGDPCKVCGSTTETIFNINFKKTPICEDCANSITMQQMQWISAEMPKILKRKKELHESLANVMGYIDSPIPRRRLQLDDDGKKVVKEARDVLEEENE